MDVLKPIFSGGLNYIISSLTLIKLQRPTIIFVVQILKLDRLKLVKVMESSIASGRASMDKRDIGALKFWQSFLLSAVEGIRKVEN